MKASLDAFLAANPLIACLASSRPSVNDGLLTLAALLVIADHRWSGMTWAACALAAGVILSRGRQRGHTGGADDPVRQDG